MKKGLIAILVLLLGGCSPKVISYLNADAKFRTFSSYTLINVKVNKRQLAPEATQLLGVIDQRIAYHIEDVRGYQPSNVDPDLVVRYELVSSTRTDVRNNNNVISPYVPSYRISTQVIYESVILIEILENKKLVWQGSYDLNQARKDQKNEKAIKNAIDLIFTTYPYKAGDARPDPTLTNKKNS